MAKILLFGVSTQKDRAVRVAAEKIGVDVTAVKQVKKLPGAKPGMVIYHTYRTVIANPYADIVVDALNAEKKDSE